jgi:hypothetical protein
MDQSYNLSTLINKALDRTSKRIVPFFITYLAGFGMFLGIAAIIAVIAFLLLPGFKNAELTFMPYVMAGVGGVIAIAALFYVGAWFSLAMMKVIMGEEKITAKQAFVETKEQIPGLIKLQLLMMVFFIALLPIGMLSIFIILILWSFWSSLAMFVFIDQKRNGLDNLWASRWMINQKFWRTAGYMALVNFGIQIIMNVIPSFLPQDNEAATIIGGLVIVIFSFLSTPFIVSFNYEIYKALPKPEKIEKPTVWINIAIVSGILVIIGPLLLLSFSR